MSDKVLKPEVYVISGCTSPLGKIGSYSSGIDGYELYIVMPNGTKFKISNKELEQFKV
jgi:hypothetical protein